MGRVGIAAEQRQRHDAFALLEEAIEAVARHARVDDAAQLDMVRREHQAVVGGAHADMLAARRHPEAQAFVDKVRARYGADTIVSNTVDAHYNLTRFFIEAIKKAGSDDKEQIIDALGGLTLMSGNGEVTLRADDRHVDLNVLIAEVSDGKLLLKKYIGQVVAPSQCAG